MLERKQNSFVFQFFKARSHKTIKLCRPLTAPSIFREGLQYFENRHLAPEIPLVQFFPQDRLVNLLQLSEREFLGEQLETYRRVLQLISQSFNRIVQNCSMVKGERRQFIGGIPVRLGDISSSL